MISTYILVWTVRYGWNCVKSRAGQLTYIFLHISIQLQMNLGEGRCGRIIKKVIAMTKTSSLFVRKNVVVNIYHANPLLLIRDIGIYGRQLYAGRDIGLVVWYLLRVEVVEGSIPSCPRTFYEFEIHAWFFSPFFPVKVLCWLYLKRDRGRAVGAAISGCQWRSFWRACWRRPNLSRRYVSWTAHLAENRHTRRPSRLGLAK